MNNDSVHGTIVALACLISIGCNKSGVVKETPFRIIATDVGFDAPKRVNSGLRHIVFENHGSQIHEAMLVKLPEGMTSEDYVAEVKRGSLFPKGALDYSGPGLLSPGGSSEMWLRVDPGQYLLICWNEGHAKSTPVHPFNVEYAMSDDVMPKEDLVLKLRDYRFELEGNLTKGSHVIRVETPGPAMHEVDLYRLHEGKTVAELKRWRKEDDRGPAPADAIGGALDSHDCKRVIWLRKKFTPGRYVLHCEMPLTTDSSPNSSGVTHADLGMVREIEITE